MALPRPSTCGTRPAYLDGLFRDSPTSPSLHSHSSTSSISFSSSSAPDLRALNPPLSPTRPLSPAFEEDFDDRSSVRSLRLHLSPRFKRAFNRQTYPQHYSTTSSASSKTTSPPNSNPTSRRPSLAKLQTSFSSTKKSIGGPPDKPLPQPPTQKPQGQSCHRCYYFSLRNCQGWVMGGQHGDPCDTCLV